MLEIQIFVFLSNNLYRKISYWKSTTEMNGGEKKMVQKGYSKVEII